MIDTGVPTSQSKLNGDHLGHADTVKANSHENRKKADLQGVTSVSGMGGVRHDPFNASLDRA
jgi:hypothetical protein